MSAFHSSTEYCRAKTHHKKNKSNNLKANNSLQSNNSLAAEYFVETNEEAPNPDHFSKYKLKNSMIDLEELYDSTSKLDFDYDVLESELDDDEIADKDINNSRYTESVTVESPHKENINKGDLKMFDLFGRADPGVPMSDVACCGCGACLHCQDPGIPGYLPAPKFKVIPKSELRNHVCQRCMLMKKYNIALNVSVKPEEYREIIATIKTIKALVIVVVDVMDLPNSIFPNITELIGNKRPLYVVGNKVDLLPKDQTGYLERSKEMLQTMCEKAGLVTASGIHHVQLVSAKTGYGIEELVTKLMVDWSRQGHVYILGCTNVGKSSLFNALLASDYCKSTARDFIHRATTSVWPGTTLNLLKFPVVDPAPWRLKRRAERILKSRQTHMEEERLRENMFKKTGKLSYATLIGHIGQTFKTQDTLKLPSDFRLSDPPTYMYYEKTGTVAEIDSIDREAKPVFDEKQYTESRWCHDTPGVINPAQIINKLTQRELSVICSPKLVRPRSFVLKPSQVMFVTGLGRIDYVEGAASIYMTVFASSRIPIHVVNGTEAEEFYAKHIGTDTFRIPLGDSERLSLLPALESKTYTVTGSGWSHSAADVLLSSIGWVAVTAGTGMEVQLKAYTPGGLGCGLREPSLLCYAVKQRGKRIRGSAAYTVRSEIKYS